MTKRLRSPYGGIFSGKAQEFLDRVSEYSPDELMIANFNLMQAKILELIEGGTRYNKQAKMVLAALELLVNDEQITPEYMAYVKMLLADASLDRLSNIMVQISALPLNAARISQEGSAKVQIKILQDFMVSVLQVSDDPSVREFGVATIQQLRLDGGMSDETTQRLIQLAEIRTIAAEDDEDEDDTDEEE